MKNSRIVVDVDGVMLNWSEGFNAWATHYKHLTLKEDSEFIFDVADRFEEDDLIGFQLVHQFNNSDYIQMLEPWEGAVEHVERLVEDGYTFHAITSLGSSPRAAENRKANLEAVFGENVFVNIQCLSVFESKSHSLLPYKDTGCYWVEDNMNNALIGHRLGLNAVLMHDTTNKDDHHDDIPRVEWHSLYEMISNE